jgi:hypothetical protein
MRLEIPNRLMIITEHYDPNGRDDNNDFVYVKQGLASVKLRPEEAKLIGYVAGLEFPSTNS